MVHYYSTIELFGEHSYLVRRHPGASVSRDWQFPCITVTNMDVLCTPGEPLGVIVNLR